MAGIHASSAGQPEGEVGKLLSVVIVPAPHDTGLTPEVRDPMLAGIDGAVNSRRGHRVLLVQRPTRASPWRARPAPRRLEAGSRTRRGSPAITNPTNDPALPQYVVVAMVEQGGFGADAAAPIVRRVIDFLNGNPIRLR